MTYQSQHGQMAAGAGIGIATRRWSGLGVCGLGPPTAGPCCTCELLACERDCRARSGRSGGSSWSLFVLISWFGGIRRIGGSRG
jgi:hypothetical protein